MSSYLLASTKPQAGWVSPALIDDRLEAEYYNPDYVALDIQLENSGLPIDTLGNISKTFTGPFGSNLPSSLYRQSGIPLLRVQNIGDFGINWDNLVFLDQPTHKQLGDSRLITGDLALAKSGSFGKIAPIWPAYGECNITEHILGIRVTDPKIDPIFLAAFLVSSYGLSQIKRKALGTILKYLGVQVSRSIKIPRADPNIQAYIGDKVRLAEKCREEALISKTQVSQKLREQIQHNEQEVTTHDSDAFKKLLGIPYCVSIKPELLSERLTAVSYNNNFLEFMALVDASEHVFVELGEHYDISAMIGWKNLTTADYVRQGIKMLRVTDISGCFVLLNDAIQVSSSKVDEQPQIHLQTGDVIFSKDGTLGIAAVMPKVDELVCAGSTLARLRKRTQLLDPYYLCAFLNSPYTAAQISYYISGIAQPHITQEYIKQIKVPLLPTSAMLEIGREFHRYDFMSRTAYDLIAEAKSDIEKLVEGKLGVSELASKKARQPTWNDIQKLLDDQSH